MKIIANVFQMIICYAAFFGVLFTIDYWGYTTTGLFSEVLILVGVFVFTVLSEVLTEKFDPIIKK